MVWLRDLANAVADSLTRLLGRPIRQPIREMMRPLSEDSVASEELAPRFGTNYFEDPTFGELLRSLHEGCRICLIEWLRRGGHLTLRWLPRARPAWRTRLRKALAALRGAR